jgi:hypothetical protein
MRFQAIAFATAGLVLTASLAIAQATQTLTGIVSDAMCGKKHMMQGATAAQCTRECVKSGSDYALVVGNKVYTLKGDKAAFDKFAGANVVVKGKTSGSTVIVESIKAAM